MLTASTRQRSAAPTRWLAPAATRQAPASSARWVAAGPATAAGAFTAPAHVPTVRPPAALRQPTRRSKQVRRRLQPAPRGRIVLFLLSGAVGVALLGLSWLTSAGGAGDGARLGTPAAVVVHDGDTLWSIARSVAPQRDPRQEVGALLRINHLRGPDLFPGQVLRTR